MACNPTSANQPLREADGALLIPHDYASYTALGNAVQSPTQGAQLASAQPKSVKHLTCWYWAKGRCRLADDQCLYSHFNTGKLAAAPMQLQAGLRAVAGRNATISQPGPRESKRHHRARLAVGDPQIDKQLERIRAKAKQLPTRTAVKAQQPPTSSMVSEERSSFARPFDFNQPHPDDYMCPAPGDSYRNLSIGIGASNQPVQGPFDRSPHQFSGSFVPSSSAAYYPSRSTHFDASGGYGMGGDYGSMGGGYGAHYSGPSSHFGGIGSGHGHISGSGPDPHHFGGWDNPNLSSSSTQPGNPSDHLIRELQQQSQVKDKAITALADIIAILEINYGFAIKEQTDTLETLLTIARSMKKEEQVPVAQDPASNTPPAAPKPRQTPSYGHPPAHHERIMTAMQGSLNLIRLEKNTLVESRSRKVAVGEELEAIFAGGLLPRGWIER
ncbi:hypothetical protein BDR22DRAFT_655108 [Usnea florida]